MPARDTKPRFLQSCVVAVVKQHRRPVGRAFAICTAHFQRHGYLRPGTQQPTAKGRELHRRHLRRPGAKKKLREYEQLLTRTRAGPPRR